MFFYDIIIIGENMKDTFKKMNKPLFFLMLIYSILGLIMIFSASSMTAVLQNKVEESYYFKRQLVFVIVSWFFGLFLVLRMPTSKYKKLAPIGIVAIIAALALLFPYGKITNSALSWYDLGFFNLQPSEFAKSIMIVFLAVYFDHLIKTKNYRWDKIAFPFFLVAIIFGLIAIQPDLGTAAIIVGIAGLIFLSLPIKTKSMNNMKMGAIIAILLGIIIMLTSGQFLNKEQTSRLNYKNPCTRYIQKTGYQVCNGFIAISNGGLFGVGLGNSTQKYLYLPEAYTDFIFPIICEELGTIVGILIIIGFLIILFELLRIAKSAGTVRGSIIAYGTFAYILLHLLVNFMGILALIPLTGVPVPFLSYGGSFYINLMFMLFLCERVQIESGTYKTKELIRRL
jgi:cell division protein FtsW